MSSKKTGTKPTDVEKLNKSLTSEVKRLRTALKAAMKPAKVKRPPKQTANRHQVTVVVPDSHGSHVDTNAQRAFLDDLVRIKPDRIVMLGDHLDAGGTFNAHQRSYTKEMTESYDEDVADTNEFLDGIMSYAPNAQVHYIEGNHEQHVERFLARNFHSRKDAEVILGLIGPEAVLRLKQRGIKYYRSSERYQGISIPGTICFGKLYYTHGISTAKHAAAVHMERFGASVIFGHCHRAQSHVGRTVTSRGIGGWCPGTLAKLQPLYAHTAPTSWSHGYAVVTTSERTGNFAVQLVPIVDGESMLQA